MASARSRLVIGYLSAFGNMIVASSSATCTQALQGAIPDFQLSVARSLLQSVIYIIGGTLAGADFKIQRETIPGLLYLGFMYLLYNVGYYGATVYLPLTETYGVAVTATIVTAILHSRLVFYIDIMKSKIIALLLCIGGIILAAQPGWLFNRFTRSSEVVSFENVSNVTPLMNITSQNVTEVNEGGLVLGYILSVIAGVTNGLMFDINGKILKDIKPIVKVTYAVSFCMISSVAFMFYMEEPVLKMDLTQFMLVLGHGVLSAATSFFFVLSAQYIPGPSLSAVYSLQMVNMIIYQYTIMHSIQPGNYNGVEVLGCTIIIFGASMPPLVDILMHRAKSNELP